MLLYSGSALIFHQGDNARQTDRGPDTRECVLDMMVDQMEQTMCLCGKEVDLICNCVS